VLQKVLQRFSVFKMELQFPIGIKYNSECGNTSFVLSLYWLRARNGNFQMDFIRVKNLSYTSCGSRRLKNYSNHLLKEYFGALHLYYPNDNFVAINISPRCG